MWVVGKENAGKWFFLILTNPWLITKLSKVGFTRSSGGCWWLVLPKLTDATTVFYLRKLRLCLFGVAHLGELLVFNCPRQVV